MLLPSFEVTVSFFGSLGDSCSLSVDGSSNDVDGLVVTTFVLVVRGAFVVVVVDVVELVTCVVFCVLFLAMVGLKVVVYSAEFVGDGAVGFSFVIGAFVTVDFVVIVAVVFVAVDCVVVDCGVV